MKCVAVLGILAQPAAACVTAETLATGVSFTREDGKTGLVQSAGDVVAITHAVGAGPWQDTRTSRLGIYDLTADPHLSNAVTVGGGYPHYAWSFAKLPPVPAPGTGFSTRIKQTRTEDIGTQTSPAPTVSAYDSTYTFLPAQRVKLSGCPYPIIPVEAAFSNGGHPALALLPRPWLWA